MKCSCAITESKVVLWQSHPQWCLAIALVGISLWAMSSGAVSLAWPEIVTQLWYSWLPGAAEETDVGQSYVFWQLRLPRVALALCVGAAMGLCGALTQGLFRNPLADPGLLGVSGGAACAAALSVVLLGAVSSQAGLQAFPLISLMALPLAAFTGALMACGLLEAMARFLLRDSMAGLLLSGIALNALAGAVIGLCSYLANDVQLRKLTFWMLGSLAAANWWVVCVLLLLLVACWWGMTGLLQSLNVMTLGSQVAHQSGVSVQRLRLHVIVIVALLSGFVTAWCGMIGFIGLVAPHIVRLILGPDQRCLAPYSMGLGALLLVLADTLARTVAVPAELPVGIFTAIFGAPFFLSLLVGPSLIHKWRNHQYRRAMTMPAKTIANHHSGQVQAGQNGATPLPLLRCEALRYIATPVQTFGPFHLSIQAGEHIALLGPSGAGKSTLLALLAHDRVAHSGSASLHGKPLYHWTLAALSRSRAVLPQSHEVAFGLPVELVIRLGRVSVMQDTHRRSIVYQAAKLAAIEHKLQARFDTLSGGEKARVQLARVFAQLWDVRNGLLLVDEPVAALDPGLQAHLLQALQQYAQARGHALLAVLHDVNHAMQHFKRILGMKHGALIADVATADCTPTLLESLYGVAFRQVDLSDGRTVLSIA